MPTNLPGTDVVVIGLGAAGGVAVLPLAEAGMSVVGLEAGTWLTNKDFAPDEIRNNVRDWPMAVQKCNHEVPTHRVNAGFNFSHGRFLGNMNLSYQGKAFWQDVLDSRFHGYTDAYTQVNGAFGVRWAQDKITTTIKVNNLFDEKIQSHIFGDILRRQVIGELRVQF